LERLGSDWSDARDIKGHAFFKPVDWGKVMMKGMRPPFTPKLAHRLDTSNFAEEFTQLPTSLTPPVRKRDFTPDEVVQMQKALYTATDSPLTPL
jgi:hypothetical protein